MRDLLVIDGAYGEGGGQILRTALALAALSGQPVQFVRIRAGRRRPGLAAQHLTAVRAAAALCSASLDGDRLASQDLIFRPQQPVRPGHYSFDVAAAREGGSAGAAALVLQTVMVPLALCAGPSEVVVYGGTHLPQSPPFDYLKDVWLPVLRQLGIRATVALEAWGWFPVGKGAVRAAITGEPPGVGELQPLQLLTSGPLLRVAGRAVVSNLPEQSAQRMADRATALLAPLGVRVDVRAERAPAACAGTGIFLLAEYQQVCAGFSALGARGRSAERVAEEAAEALLYHDASGAAVDPHLADQLLLPLALAAGPSRLMVEQVTRHLETNTWTIEKFGIARIAIEQAATRRAIVVVSPINKSPVGMT
jgi:RNA 3'-terminal phosphate cyclase (ATP)